MFLFLTYHRVLATTHATPEFYDVPASRFEQQLDTLDGSGFRCLTTGDLVSGEKPHPRTFILSFDDGTKDHLDVVAPILKQRKCRATFFVPTAKLGRPAYLSDEGVKELASQGHVIGLHSHEHRRMDQMSAAEAGEQMRLSRERIQRLTGVNPDIFAPPGGFLTAALRAVAVQHHVRLVRTMHWGYNRNLDLLNLQCIPINSRTTDKQFEKTLQFRNVSLAYALKQMGKSVLPVAWYQRFRDKVYSP